MNRKKKINQILKAKHKKAQRKNAPVNKPKYISKADREKLTTTSETTIEVDETLIK